MNETTWMTRPLEQRDWEAWQRLFKGYCAFYKQATSEEHLRRVWSWIHEDHSVEAVVAVPAGDRGEAVGLVHMRSWVRPLRGEIAGYLDDIFVDPAVRGPASCKRCSPRLTQRPSSRAGASFAGRLPMTTTAPDAHTIAWQREPIGSPMRWPQPAVETKATRKPTARF